jgi:hypothetical protein
LARKAVASVKTIENVEKGRDVYLVTLGKIAKALDVDPKTLLASASPEPAAPTISKEPRRKLTFYFKMEFEGFDESDDLIEFMRRFFRGDDDVHGVSPGSVVVTVDATLSSALSVVETFCKGEFPKYVDRMECPATPEFINAIAKAVNSVGPTTADQIETELISSPPKRRIYQIALSETRVLFLTVDRKATEEVLVLGMGLMNVPRSIDASRDRDQYRRTDNELGES